MNVLIIGLGSIARKHIQALKSLYNDVRIFAWRSGSNAGTYEDVVNITSLDDCPEFSFVIISNPTALHGEAIKKAAYLRKPLFIEKPPFHSISEAEACLTFIRQHPVITYTAFNLRFLACLSYLKNNLPLNKVQEVNVYCGSYLPEWRPGTDYKQSYSAHAQMGGGVHLDLIHELDYILWIFGQPEEIKHMFRNASEIKIDAPDYANYTLVYPNFVIHIILNYYRRDPKRTCEVIMTDCTWNVNLLRNSVHSSNKEVVLFQSQETPTDMYKKQMRYFCTVVEEGKQPFNSLDESVATLKIALS